MSRGDGLRLRSSRLLWSTILADYYGAPYLLDGEVGDYVVVGGYGGAFSTYSAGSTVQVDEWSLDGVR